MERKMMLMLPKRGAASSMCEKGLWRIFLAQSTGAMFSDNGLNFLSSWYQIEVNCCSTSSYGRNVLEKMREEAIKKKEDLLLPASEQMYLLMGTQACFSLFQARRGDGSLSQEVETDGRSGAHKGCGQLWPITVDRWKKWSTQRLWPIIPPAPVNCGHCSGQEPSNGLA